MQTKNIHIIGSGGVGFHLVTALCQSIDPRKIIVYDDDNLTGGLGHARLPQASLSTMKVDLLRGHLLVVWGRQALPTFVKERFTGYEPEEGDLVVDCSDADPEPRIRFFENTKATGARFVRISYDGKNGTVTVAGGPPLIAGVKGGYAEVPTLGLSFLAGGIGSEVVRNIYQGHEAFVEFQVSLADLGAWRVIPERVAA